MNSEILRHNFTLRVSTEAFESRILSSIYILLTLGPALSYQAFLKGQCWGHFSSSAI